MAEPALPEGSTSSKLGACRDLLFQYRRKMHPASVPDHWALVQPAWGLSRLEQAPGGRAHVIRNNTAKKAEIPTPIRTRAATKTGVRMTFSGYRRSAWNCSL